MRLFAGQLILINIWHLLWMQISVEILRLLDAADDIWAVVLDVQRALNYDISLGETYVAKQRHT